MAMGGFRTNDRITDKMWRTMEHEIIHDMIANAKDNQELLGQVLMPAMYCVESAPTPVIRNGGRRILIALLKKWDKDGFYATSPFAAQPVNEVIKEMKASMEAGEEVYNEDGDDPESSKEHTCEDPDCDKHGDK